MPTSDSSPFASGKQPLSPDQLIAIRQFDTCTIANAIERFGVRLRNEGFTRPGLHCVTGGSPRLLGYAATSKIRSADPPLTGSFYSDRTDWWAAIERLPVPRIAVIQDVDPSSGLGSAFGEIHAAILKAFHCEGAITNGAVRDVSKIADLPFPAFASSVSVSHSYSHMVGYGCPVEIFGLRIQYGTLLYADCHGVVSIPAEIAGDLPRVAAEIRAKEQRIIDVCQSPGFSPERLLEAIKSTQ
jgi:4-hydroxy-4-methyl-2-oxoglutarate aldolase